VALLDFGRALRQLPPGRSDRKFLLHAAVACVIGTMVSGVFEKNLGDTEVLTMFLAILCLGYLAASFPALVILKNSDIQSLEP
jgi:putative inorganic carbon (hco3(-)) transporter